MILYLVSDFIFCCGVEGIVGNPPLLNTPQQACVANLALAASHLEVSTFYYYEPHPEMLVPFTNVVHTTNLTVILEMNEKYGQRGLYTLGFNGPMDVWCTTGPDGLCPNWKENVMALKTAIGRFLPTSSNNTTPLLGIFLGDEITCFGRVSFSAFEEVVAYLRQVFPSPSILYENECMPTMQQNWTTIPEGLDWISIDMYSPSDPVSMINATKAFYTSYIFPKLHPAQKCLIVPGTFANPSNPVPAQDAAVLEMMKGLWAWINEDVRFVGLNPWHFFDLDFPSLPIEFHLGLNSLPKTLEFFKNTIGPNFQTPKI